MKENRPLQRKPASSPKESPAIESKGLSASPPAFQLKAGDTGKSPVQQKQAAGALPQDLVSGFAATTGHDLSDVQVHRNSDKPSQVGALAYAQGNDIHLGAGQEQHLAHEAAHVVQQREGRVQANTQAGGMPVNDSKSLESEADSMGAKAAQMKAAPASATAPTEEEQAGKALQAKTAAGPVQRALTNDQITAIATAIFNACDGPGTDEEAIHAALAQLKHDTKDIDTLKERYLELYDTSLVVVLNDELSGDDLAQALEALTPTGEANDILTFPWKGTTYGAEKVQLSKAADGKEAAGQVLKGTEVEVTGKTGDYYKVKAKTEAGTVMEGYLPAANVSSTISALNRTVAAVDGDLDKMWTDSFNADKSVVTEYGAAFAEKDGKISAKNIGTGGSGSVAIDRTVADDEKFIGDAHTHPYSTSEGSHEGIAFSAGDISNIRFQVKQGYQKLVEAGTCRFALVVTNYEKAKQFFDDNSEADISKTWNDAYSAATGTMQESVIEAVRKVIGAQGSNGLSFYATTDRDKLKFDEK